MVNLRLHTSHEITIFYFQHLVDAIEKYKMENPFIRLNARPRRRCTVYADDGEFAAHSPGSSSPGSSSRPRPSRSKSGRLRT